MLRSVTLFRGDVRASLLPASKRERCGTEWAVFNPEIPPPHASVRIQSVPPCPRVVHALSHSNPNVCRGCPNVHVLSKDSDIEGGTSYKGTGRLVIGKFAEVSGY